MQKIEDIVMVFENNINTYLIEGLNGIRDSTALAESLWGG